MGIHAYVKGYVWGRVEYVHVQKVATFRTAKIIFTLTVLWFLYT